MWNMKLKVNNYIDIITKMSFLANVIEVRIVHGTFAVLIQQLMRKMLASS